MANAMMLHSSSRWFSTGVPVAAIRWRAVSARLALAVAVCGFLIACASSSDDAVPGHLREAGVAPQQAVAGDDDVGVRRRGDRVAPGAAVMHDDAQVRREPLGFSHPVPHDGRGRDDQRRPLVVVRGEGEEHRGLPEPHVVGEDPAEVVAFEPDEPVEPVALVVAQRDLDRVGFGDALGRLRAPGARERAGEPAVRVQVHLELGVVVLVGVRRGFEHRGRVDAAEPADELRDAGALTFGEEGEPTAERHQVVVRA